MKKEYDMKPLTRDEARVIIHKGTEVPYSGAYWNTKAKGLYICRQCGAHLYRSEDKFDSGCGWPSFDDEIEGAVIRKPDADGRRTEILCANCDGHLGHVFLGEGFTDKDTRHCVNSISMVFVPEQTCSDTAIFAGGCFWGIEDYYAKLDGVCDVVSGYIGGTTENPTYREVTTGRTGHAEAVKITFDPKVVTFAALARKFFELHDPTQLNRQGPDVGTQYRSAVFYTDEAQKVIAEDLIKELMKLGYPVVTEVVQATKFYEAEDYHQDYTARTGQGACHAPIPRFDIKPNY